MIFGFAGCSAWRFRVSVGVLLISVLFAEAAVAQRQEPRTLLAVFAHPDDETWVGPVLARYARSGVKVYLAIATKGEKGVSAHAGIPAGEPLAAARHAEAVCACRQLGIEPPIFFNFNNRELDTGSTAREAQQNLHALAERTRELIKRLEPQVIITWGPEGGYGHPDHRLVSDAVTEVVQSESPRRSLYYVGTTTHQATLLNVWPTERPGGWLDGWPGIDPAYLTVTIAYAEQDRDAYHRALECHKSQFTPEGFTRLEQALDQGWNGKVSFRPWFGNRKSQDLFK
jgi:LmbE family N-acetylglucosaminyl deacetylase